MLDVQRLIRKTNFLPTRVSHFIEAGGHVCLVLIRVVTTEELCMLRVQKGKVDPSKDVRKDSPEEVLFQMNFGR